MRGAIKDQGRPLDHRTVRCQKACPAAFKGSRETVLRKGLFTGMGGKGMSFTCHTPMVPYSEA